jgi:hypothetical protein
MLGSTGRDGVGMRLNWRKIVLLVLLCELLLLYWSTIQHTETVRELQTNDRHEQASRPVTVVPKPAPGEDSATALTNG